MVEEWSDGKVNDSMNFRQDFTVGVCLAQVSRLQQRGTYMRFSARDL